MSGIGYLFIVSGPSGAGKSTVIGEILKQRPELSYSISYTTRLPRGNEKDGVDYHFITEDAFREKIGAGELAEWAEVHGNMYGTSAIWIEEMTAAGQDVLLDIDVEGATKLLVKYPEAISIFLAPPNIEELQKRLSLRDTDGPEAVELRLKNAEREMALSESYDYVVENDDLLQTVSRLGAIIDKETLDE